MVRAVQRNSADGLVGELPINDLDTQLAEDILDVHEFVISERRPDALVNILGQLVPLVPGGISGLPKRNGISDIIDGLLIAVRNVQVDYCSRQLEDVPFSDVRRKRTEHQGCLAGTGYDK